MVFTIQQTLTIRSLAAGIFPRDEAIPSAADLPVTEMLIDITSAWPEATVELFAASLDTVNDIALVIFGVNVADLDGYRLAEFIEIIANDERLNLFWKPFRELVAVNYYGLPPAYEAIGLPGPNIDRGGFDADGVPAWESKI